MSDDKQEAHEHCWHRHSRRFRYESFPAKDICCHCQETRIVTEPTSMGDHGACRLALSVASEGV